MGFSVFLFLLTLLFMFPISSVSQSNPNVTLGSSLTTNNGESSSWISPSGEFAFGFLQISSGGGYLLAIWFNKIPERTIIWSANGNNLAPQGSIIQLLQDGRFVLSDSSGRQIWSANTGSSRVAYGAMLDSGNFILGSNASAILWQSFDEPTDTLLPTQLLGQGGQLVSSLSQMNFSSGKYLLIMQTDGNLVLYTKNFPLDNVNSPYWSTRSVGSGFQFIFNQTGSLILTARNGSIINLVFSNTVSASQLYQRLTLDYDGVLRHYVYPKSGNSTAGRLNGWSVLDLVPTNICLSITQYTGGGACGFNSYCSLSTDQRPVCNCPDGYTLCILMITWNCNESKETELFYFVDMPNTDWPLSDFEYYQPVSEDWCRQICLDDCFCAAAIFRNSNCWKKKFPLSNGRKDPSVGGKALIKVRRDQSNGNINGSTDPKRKKNSVLIITGSTLLGTSVFLNILLFFSTFFFGFWLRKGKHNVSSVYSSLPGLSIRSFSYKELEKATHDFKEELGRGACSIVYKGTLKHENGDHIAVKKLNDIIKQTEQEFQAEVSSISKTNHKNLVQLVGFCNEGQNRLLVYEYMSNGSLASYLFDKPRPNWYKRVQIACAIARGLSYLHEECSNQIIHCDIKPQNILLDHTLTAKISDFGLAKLLSCDQTKTTTGIRGTRGYVAPEWFRSMPVTVKVDVYSFGILLLELVCCRKNVETEMKDEKQVILSEWAYDCYEEGKVHLLIAFDEEAQDDFKRVGNFVMIAIWCIQEEPSLRPSMKRVVQMLEGSVQVSVPPYPNPSFISPNS
ncbi:hypothetical protein M9H77_06178 [Catharanthus roseus]|uniref:Uncharacterized protein n=1 Tax=Catharanthus roseus TaxID=4058 RepID=A0ACC0BRJ4_CATRO|nr:hypothetical protein M9H77_06178 [Catharanthus roseus]